MHDHNLTGMQFPLFQPFCDLVVSLHVSCFSFLPTQVVLSFYSVQDMIIIVALYKTTVYADAFIHPKVVALPHPLMYFIARVALWAMYSFWTGLYATGLWIIAHECGHQAFSESKTINNTVGWILHSSYVLLYNKMSPD